MWSKEGFRVVISPDLIEEFKNCPDDVMDFFSIIIEDLGGEHMGFLMQGEKERIKMIRVETLKSLGILLPHLWASGMDLTDCFLEATLPVITDEVNYGIEKYIGECEGMGNTCNVRLEK